MQAKSAEVVGHGSSAVAADGTSKQGGHQRAQVAVTEAVRHMAEAAQGAEQRMDAWIAEAQRRNALSRG